MKKNSPYSLELSNDHFSLKVLIKDDRLYVFLGDPVTGFDFSESPYYFQATWKQSPTQLTQAIALDNLRLESLNDEIIIRGDMASLQVTSCFTLSTTMPGLTEKITIKNDGTEPFRLEDFACGMLRTLTDRLGRPIPEVKEDRFRALPFLHRSTDATEWDNDYEILDLLQKTGSAIRLGVDPVFVENQGALPSWSRFSEGWAWQHDETTLCIFKFNQQAIEFSPLAIETDPQCAYLRFGGASVLNGEPSRLLQLQPGESFEFGETYYQFIQGGYTQSAYAMRRYLDEKGCKFPGNYNPPVHWNELYDNPEWNLASPGRPSDRSKNGNPTKTRHLAYTRALLLEEAKKAQQYGCQALYLDPGWDTTFGSFLWGIDWLGNRRDFVELLKEDYGLKVSLHCPLATWMSLDGRSNDSWPREAERMDPFGEVIPGSICLGSIQYLAEAEVRLLEHCRDGVTFLMFDGNWYNDGCWNPDHGHPVPYTYEDHCRANLDLAQRIHKQFPDVLIEMHDMISGGSILRYTPVYYKYGLPDSYDENWGFELMWQPMEDILSGRARSLYYYNLACNVPVYLHIDLRDDNIHCLVLWWYASTCRHLGIGGTHEDALIASAQQNAMRRYRELERFYKRGEFYGYGEEVHVHVIPEESAFVVNLFNLSAEERVISAKISVEELGIHPDQWFISPKSGWFDPFEGTFNIKRRMDAWSAQIVSVTPLLPENSR